jgi:hypothetical protein
MISRPRDITARVIRSFTRRCHMLRVDVPVPLPKDDGADPHAATADPRRHGRCARRSPDLQLPVGPGGQNETQCSSVAGRGLTTGFGDKKLRDATDVSGSHRQLSNVTPRPSYDWRYPAMVLAWQRRAPGPTPRSTRPPADQSSRDLVVGPSDRSMLRQPT